MATDERYQREQIERAQIVIDQVAEYIAMKWTKTQIFNHLRQTFPDLKRRTVRALIRRAGKDIMERYGINPEEYKGQQIAFYEYVIRGQSYDKKDGCKSTVKERLVAAERLDKLFNLENIVNADPAEKAAQIIEFIKQAKETVGNGVDPNAPKDESDVPKENEIAKPTKPSRANVDGRSTVADSDCKDEEPDEKPDGEQDKKDKTSEDGDNLDEDGNVLEEFGKDVV